MSEDAIGCLDVDMGDEGALDVLADLHSEYELTVDGVFANGHVTFAIHNDN